MTPPTMAEIGAAESNGLTVASTFAGFGGSSLGYRMAGYRAVAAVEFDRVASKVYTANASEGTIVNPDGVGDVREVAGDWLREIAGGELDVLDGSPPCQGWSTAGNRDLDGENCDLYGRFVEMVGEAMPRAFVAENVTGIVKGPAKARFVGFLDGFRAHGYEVAWCKLDASRLGVAQKRERIIVIGLRQDEGVDPADVFGAIRQSAEPLAFRHVLPGVARFVRAAPPGKASSYKYREERTFPRVLPVPTVCASGLDMAPANWLTAEMVDGTDRPVTVEDVRTLSGFPPDFVLSEGMALSRAWHGFGNSVPPPMAAAWAGALRDALT